MSTLPTTRRSFVRPVVLAIVLSTACSESTHNAPPSPLAGLNAATARDSMGSPVPNNPSNAAPGVVRGTVLGPSTPGSSGDTLASAPKVANVSVVAYPVTGGSPASPTLGPKAGATTTAADGKFTLPTLAAGAYVVTFTPPSSSPYRGVWTTSHISAASEAYPWWVVLPRN